ncbi:sugar porter family MFS transporter [Gilliamella sp. wkB112]|uniref:sugar porter family MFS transporter n=1 Tax=Gilliamella sp. wkB112 TaxID=3120257 RepID=UPI00080DD657|nr:sugar porter family MFS transporter [Gilliamella apicola]OCG02078.1 D-xylose-proton symporter [Gilliamella apicola]
MNMNKIKYNMTYVMLCCSVAALGGFLLGYDTSVISGAIEPLSRHYELSPAETGWAVSNVIIGCIIGCFTAGGLCDKLGRKKSLIITAILFVLSVLGTAYATSFTMFVLFRMLGGFCIGLASVITPTYLAEMAPSMYRGRVGALNMFCCVGGQVIVQFVNYYIAKGASPEWMELLGWRYILGVAIIPCLFFIVLIWFIPESPRWNIMKGFEQQALKTLTKISNLQHAQQTMEEIKNSFIEINQHSTSKITWNKKTMIFLFLGCALAVCSMSTGINVIQYFGPSLLLNISANIDEAMFKSSFLALAQFLGVITGMYITDKMGRLKLVMLGSICAFFSMSYTFIAFYYNFPGIWAVLGLFVFMYTFGASWGQVVWTLISEIFPNQLRTFGTGVSISMMWATNFVIALLFPILNKNEFLVEKFHGGFPIIIFACFAIISLYFAWRFIPETKGIALEDIEQKVLDKFYKNGTK